MLQHFPDLIIPVQLIRVNPNPLPHQEGRVLDLLPALELKPLQQLIHAQVREVLKHGTLSVGFIGLAETLKALIGEHHGESERARVLGLEIIGHMRARMDEESRKRNLNFSLLATPAEGLSGRFVKIDKEKYGVIEGITDRVKVFPLSDFLDRKSVV